MKRHLERRHTARLALLTLACVLFLVTEAPAQIMSRQLVCPGRPIPAGWIKVDASTSPADCGGDAWIIELYTNKSAGSAMTVCADQPTPPGWETLGFATSTGQCVGPTFATGNIKAIRRLG
ncbi:MAG TPA: hypothetical protein VFR03_09345 [Thermoanaerobaculia bacterium]|nr:hypothetical protein [Thermoanaerobaculia bacterium]